MVKTTPLFSGSSGNCTYIRCGDAEFLVDAGVSYRNIKNALNKLETDISNICSIFITHEHSDHIKGLEVLAKNNPHIPIYINTASFNVLEELKYFNAKNSAVILDPGDEVRFGGVVAKVFETPHDSLGSVCYRFDYGEESVGFATDIGEITPDIRRALYGCINVVIESNHDIAMLKNGPYPYILKKRILSDHGHLSNDDCAKFLPELVSHGTEKIILAHLSGENNTPETAYRACAGALTEAGLTPEDVKLSIAMKSIL